MKMTSRICLLLAAFAAHAVMAAGEELQQDVPFTHIFTDTAGESHFEDSMLPFNFMTLPAGDKAGMHAMQIGGHDD